MDADASLKAVGEWGRMQKAVCAVVCLAQIPMAVQLVLMAFVGRPAAAVVCRGRHGLFAHNGTGDPCGRCDEPVAVDDGWPAIATEWSLVCSRSYLLAAAQSATMLGVLAGCIVCGPLADAWGRRPTLIACTALSAAASFYAAVAAGYNDFVAARFICGVGLAGHGLASFSLAAEYTPSDKRTAVSMCQTSMFGAGIACLALLAAASTDWRQLTFMGGLLVALCTLGYAWTPESVRWLCTAGEQARARRTLRRIAAANGTMHRCGADSAEGGLALMSRSCSSSDTEPSGDSDLLPAKRPAAKSDAGGLRALLADRTAARMLLVQMFSWFAGSFAYYGVTMASGELGGHLHVSVALSGLVELPGYGAVWLLRRRVGRKHFICVPFLVGAACMSLAPLSPLLLPLAAKCCVSVAFALCWQHSAELMPTPARNAGLGACSMCARIGGVLAPVVAVAAKSRRLPFAAGELSVYAAACALAAAAVHAALPETRGKRLPDTVQHMVDMDKA